MFNRGTLFKRLGCNVVGRDTSKALILKGTFEWFKIWYIFWIKNEHCTIQTNWTKCYILYLFIIKCKVHWDCFFIQKPVVVTVNALNSCVQITLWFWVSGSLWRPSAFFFFLSLRLLQIPTTTWNCPIWKSAGREQDTTQSWIQAHIQPQTSVHIHSLYDTVTIRIAFYMLWFSVGYKFDYLEENPQLTYSEYIKKYFDLYLVKSAV